jgi:hypothetical protein
MNCNAAVLMLHFLYTNNAEYEKLACSKAILQPATDTE